MACDPPKWDLEDTGTPYNYADDTEDRIEDDACLDYPGPESGTVQGPVPVSVGSFDSDYNVVNNLCLVYRDDCDHGHGPVGLEARVPSQLPWDIFVTSELMDYNKAHMLLGHAAGTALLIDQGPSEFLFASTDWDWTHDDSREEYPLLAHDFFGTFDNVNTYRWWATNGSCLNMAPAPPPLPVGSAPGRVPSAPQACVPGTADFQLAARAVLAADDDHASLWVVPLTTDENVSFPERAWMRELEVVSWGSADNLQLAGHAETLMSNGWAFRDTTAITKPVSGPSVTTWAAGQRSMSSLLGIESLSQSGTPALPTVRLTWSCEMNAEEPHAEPVAGFGAHVGVLPEFSPIQHRLVFWVRNDGKELRFAPEGRYLDYTVSGLDVHPSGGRTFELNLAVYGAKLTGRLVPHQGSFQMVDGEVDFQGQVITIPTRTLSAL